MHTHYSIGTFKHYYYFFFDFLIKIFFKLLSELYALKMCVWCCINAYLQGLSELGIIGQQNQFT